MKRLFHLVTNMPRTITDLAGLYQHAFLKLSNISHNINWLGRMSYKGCEKQSFFGFIKSIYAFFNKIFLFSMST